MASVMQHQLVEWASRYIVASEWGRNDCVCFVTEYLEQCGYPVELPAWVRSFDSEAKAHIGAVDLYGSLSQAYASVLDGVMDRCPRLQLHGPPAVGVTPEDGVTFDGIAYPMVGAGLVVLLWDGWFLRTDRAILRIDTEPTTIWVPRRR